MYSIRKVGAAAALAALAGCQIETTPPTEAVNTTPIVIDEAMQLRDWPQTVAVFENGATPAGPNYSPLQADPNLPGPVQALVEPGIFLANTAALPVLMVVQPPWTEEIYRGVAVEPSYTMQPPLPAE